MDWVCIKDVVPNFVESENYSMDDGKEYHVVRTDDVLISRFGKYYCGRFCKESRVNSSDELEFYWELAMPDRREYLEASLNDLWSYID